ncbi:hypothetical protein IJT93_06705 [bacterium]|nr:hypothetical protein [bacterium]
MSDSLSMGFSRSNLNQDITRIVAEQGKLNYPQVLNTCYPARCLTPGLYRKTHTGPKKVQFVYVGPQDKIPVQCPKGFDLLIVMGMGFTRRETEDVTELLENTEVSSNVVLGIPLQPLQGAPQLKELAAINYLGVHEPYSVVGNAQELLKNRRKMVSTQLLERLKPLLTTNNFKWLYRGKVWEGEVPGSRDAFVSEILNRMFAHALNIAAVGSKRERAEAVDILFNIDMPLRFSIFDKSGGYRVISEFLAELGIIKANREDSSIFKVVKNLEPSAPAYHVWNGLLKEIVGGCVEERSVKLADIYRKFAKVPYGIETSHLDVLIAAAIRLLYPAVSIVKGEETLPLSYASLSKAKAFNTVSVLKFVPQAPYGSMDSLRSIHEVFGAPEACEGVRDIWEYTRDSVYNWYERLIPLTAAFEPEEGTPARVIKDFVLKAREKEAREAVCSDLIEKAGFVCLPEGEEQKAFASWLHEAKQGFTDYEDDCRRLLAERIAIQFGGSIEGHREEAEYVPILNSLFRRWFECLYPQSAVQNLTPQSHALVEMYAMHADANADYWFEIFPQQLGLPALSKWHSDNSVAFAARLARACQDLELWHIERLFPKLKDAADKEKYREILSNWVRSVMNGAKLNPEERTSVLLDLMERFCWTPAEEQE